MGRRYLGAWPLAAGAIVFVLGVSWGDLSLSSATLTGGTTGAALLVEEPFVSPLAIKAKIVSGYGKRPVPGQAPGTVPLKYEAHEGIDYAVPAGTPVRAARSGKVIFAGFSKMYASRTDKTDQHRFVIIRHADGKSSRYVHLDSLHVRPGQDVQAGQVLGLSADSDEWTQPVVHFEIRSAQGQPMNPEKVITPVKKK